jgi:hypothetical protein
MIDDELPEVPDLSDSEVERSTRGRRVRAPRRDASPRAISRTLEQLVAAELRDDPSLGAEAARRKAEARLEAMRRDDPRVLAAIQKFAPSSRAPDRNRIHAIAELAAIVALPEVSELLRSWALTPSQRGPVSELSGAVASLAFEAAMSGPSPATAVFDRLTSGNDAATWALGHPILAPSRSQRYRNRWTVTGDDGSVGHDPAAAQVANLALIRKLKEWHPRIGEVASVDATRLAAPVPQIAPASRGHLEAIRRPGLELVEPIIYKHGDQYDTVVGWKAAAIVDHDCGLPLVWTIARGGAYEPDILFETLLTDLYRFWPSCPLRILVGDSLYDTEPVCRRLVENYGIDPIFTRTVAERTERKMKVKGKPSSLSNGVPHCPVCGEMVLYKNEGWPNVEKRRLLGIPPGAPGPDLKKARTRWRCACGRFKHVELYAYHDYRDHTHYTRDHNSRYGAERRAHELGRNHVESNFARVKGRGIGARDHRKLSLRDAGISHVFSLEQLFHTARRYVHETGIYHLFAEEYVELGLDQSGAAPTRERMDEVASRRPPWLHLLWPKPGRVSGDVRDAA